MKTVSMSGSLRGNVGKKDAKKARKDGMVPCVLYGGKEQVHFTMTEKAFKPILFTPDAFLINLEVDGKKYDVILQDVQYHPVTDSVLHADFIEIMPGKTIKVSVPVNTVGVSKGVLRGGKLTKKFRKLLVKGLVENIPDSIDVDISKLDIGGSIKVSDVKVKNIDLLDPPSAMVVTVRTARVLALTPEEEEEEAAEAAAKEATHEAEGEAKE
ncbi:MAG: 50S ribosomal protein L25/general stress protein Ctc [Bacteroidales bacterium]|nr:50S ribosomal protein L25/general stress protein Ctc [Bacteroidales bacterium]